MSTENTNNQDTALQVASTNNNNNDGNVTDNKTGQTLPPQQQQFPVTVSIIPEYSALPRHELAFSPINALVVLQSGSSGQPRVPLELCILADASGSMSGRRIEECRHAVHAVIDQLREDDIITIISYNSQPTKLASGTGSDANMLHEKVDSLRASGSTNISEALRMAYSTLHSSKNTKHTKRVFLFSDGEPTSGIMNADGLARIAEPFAERDFNVSTFGIGEGISPEIMMKIADSGNGHYDFVSERRIQELTKKAFDGLSRLMATRCNLTLTPMNGVRFAVSEGNNNNKNNNKTDKSGDEDAALSSPSPARAAADNQAKQSTEIGEYTQIGDFKYDATTRFITSLSFDQVMVPSSENNASSNGVEIAIVKAEFTFQQPDAPLAPPITVTGLGKITISNSDDAARSERDPTVAVLIAMRDCGLLFDKIDACLEKNATNDAISLLREVVSELEKHMDNDLDGMVHVQLRRSKRTLERLEVEGARGARRAQLEVGHQRAAVRDRLSVCDFASSDSSNRSCEFNRGSGGAGAGVGGLRRLLGSDDTGSSPRSLGTSDDDDDDWTGTDES